ncbi:Protein CBG26754 [Caenorhabditis briggsae]|uniref:Protein CBG26754 n=1 Tax=Caenorhabditis briggsae TaxID=6238 RepID=B6IEC9_CAEBR|nr:Protein CBG26754 [Caenorhabditis briggsae]CAS01193.1 Protein CBG26754 [Caenorhabditis briggsae]
MSNNTTVVPKCALLTSEETTTV